MLPHFLSVLSGVLSIFVLIQAQDQSGLFSNFSIPTSCHILLLVIIFVAEFILICS